MRAYQIRQKSTGLYYYDSMPNPLLAFDLRLDPSNYQLKFGLSKKGIIMRPGQVSNFVERFRNHPDFNDCELVTFHLDEINAGLTLETIKTRVEKKLIISRLSGD